MPEDVKIFLFECSCCRRYAVSEERLMAFLPPNMKAKAQELLQVNGGLILNFGESCPNCKSQGNLFRLGVLNKGKV